MRKPASHNGSTAAHADARVITNLHSKNFLRGPYSFAAVSIGPRGVDLQAKWAIRDGLIQDWASRCLSTYPSIQSCRVGERFDEKKLALIVPLQINFWE